MRKCSQEEWPYVPPKGKRAYAIASWEESAQARLGAPALARWGVLGFLIVAAAVTVLSGIAVAALHRDDTQITEQQTASTGTAVGWLASDPHLQELLRAHRSAVSGD